MPISLVLSITGTNMVLVMPTAATNRDTLPMLPRNTVICDLIDSCFVLVMVIISPLLGLLILYATLRGHGRRLNWQQQFH